MHSFSHYVVDGFVFGDAICGYFQFLWIRFDACSNGYPQMPVD